MKTPDFKQNKTFSDLLGEASRPKPVPETGWNNVGPNETDQEADTDFQGTWDNFSETTVPASWYLSEDGEVRLRGRIIEN